MVHPLTLINTFKHLYILDEKIFIILNNNFLHRIIFKDVI